MRTEEQEAKRYECIFYKDKAKISQDLVGYDGQRRKKTTKKQLKILHG